LFLVAWWLVNYFPFGLVRSIVLFKPVFIVLTALSNANRGRSIANGVNAAVTILPNSVVAAILCGFVSGMGTPVVSNIAAKVLQDPNSPSELSRPTWNSQSSLMCTVAYYVATDPHSLLWGPLMSREAAVMWLVGFLAFWSVLSELRGKHVAPFPLAWLSTLLHLVSFVPQIHDEDAGAKKHAPAAAGSAPPSSSGKKKKGMKNE
jgi:hypothetical protein